MTRAGQLLQLGRAEASKEVYFVSDGQPDPATSDGVVEATALKTTGITIGAKTTKVQIATVMLAGRDQVMERSIASRTKTGRALHAFASQAGELTKALTALANSAVYTGTLSYKAPGAGKYTQIDVGALAVGNEFTSKPIALDPDILTGGLDVVLDYKDQNNKASKGDGKLVVN